MKGRLTEQYDLCLTKREMAALVQGFRIYVRDYEVTEEDAELLEGLEEAYQGDTGGQRLTA